jgi:hypothetical protein
MWNPDTDFPGANDTVITLQTAPLADEQTVVIVALLVLCLFSLVLAGVAGVLIVRRLRRARVDKHMDDGA